MSSFQSSSSSSSDEMDAGTAFVIKKLKSELQRRGGGSSGLASLGRKFKIMDDDNSRSLDMGEFKKAMSEMSFASLSAVEIRKLFEFFDADRSGTIDYEEFIQGVRDPLTPRRLALVHLAFGQIDVDNSGEVTPEEVVKAYDSSKHPDVISGKKTKEQVMREFLDTFDVGGIKDGVVTRKEFENYYTNLGANIDNEDYFELMIRNAVRERGRTSLDTDNTQDTHTHTHTYYKHFGKGDAPGRERSLRLLCVFVRAACDFVFPDHLADQRLSSSLSLSLSYSLSCRFVCVPLPSPPPPFPHTHKPTLLIVLRRHHHHHHQ